MSKHAFLIMAHNEYDILNKLLLLLDDERNDIFIHYDKKSKLPPLIELKYLNIHVFKKVDVGWGEDSQIECEMFLFNEAYKKGPFDYYHLLSGVDLPLKSNDYIHDFFDQNKGKEFVGIMDEQSCFICYKRVCYYYFFVRYERRKWGRFIVWLNKISVKFQKMVGINRNKDVICFAIPIVRMRCLFKHYCIILDLRTVYIFPKKQGNIICVCVKLIGIGAIHISGIMEILNI